MNQKTIRLTIVLATIYILTLMAVFACTTTHPANRSTRTNTNIEKPTS